VFFQIDGVKIENYSKFVVTVDEKDQNEFQKKIDINLTKKIQVGNFHGFRFEVFDRYGHILLISKSYYLKLDAIDEIERQIEYSKTDINAGPYKDVLWPNVVSVTGELFE